MLDPTGHGLLEAIVQGSAGSLRAAVFFGSRSSGVETTSASAYDLMLVCSASQAFFEATHRAGLLGRAPHLLRLADWFLPPTQVRLTVGGATAKASVVSLEDLLVSTSSARKDQFLAGRLFQDVHLVWAESAESGLRVQSAIAAARRLTLEWVAPDLPATFSARDYLSQVFRTSFRFEVRPETRARADALAGAQAERLVPIFERVLAELATEGRVTRLADGRFTIAAGVPFRRRVGRRLFMEWSRVRATLRWPKHAFTFDGWLDYIVRKAERHSGETIVLTRMERRFPFVFLWPRVFRFLVRQRRKSTSV